LVCIALSVLLSIGGCGLGTAQTTAEKAAVAVKKKATSWEKDDKKTHHEEENAADKKQPDTHHKRIAEALVGIDLEDKPEGVISALFSWPWEAADHKKQEESDTSSHHHHHRSSLFSWPWEAAEHKKQEESDTSSHHHDHHRSALFSWPWEAANHKKQEESDTSSHHHHHRSSLFSWLFSASDVSSTSTRAGNDAETDQAALLARDRSTGRLYWAKTGVCCAIGGVVGMILVFTGTLTPLRRRTVNVDQQPLLG
jgi:hypothetical protein